MRATRKKCGLPAEMRVPAEIRVTRRDAGTRSHAGKNPQKPETRNYLKPDISTRNASALSILSLSLSDRCSCFFCSFLSRLMGHVIAVPP